MLWGATYLHFCIFDMAESAIIPVNVLSVTSVVVGVQVGFRTYPVIAPIRPLIAIAIIRMVVARTVIPPAWSVLFCTVISQPIVVPVVGAKIFILYVIQTIIWRRENVHLTTVCVHTLYHFEQLFSLLDKTISCSSTVVSLCDSLQKAKWIFSVTLESICMCECMSGCNT